MEKSIEKPEHLAEVLVEISERLVKERGICCMLETVLGVGRAELEVSERRKAILGEDRPGRELRNLSTHADLNFVPVEGLS